MIPTNPDKAALQVSIQGSGVLDLPKVFYDIFPFAVGPRKREGTHPRSRRVARRAKDASASRTGWRLPGPQR